MNRIDDWNIWLAQAGAPSIKLQHILKFEHSSLAYQAAIDGLGVAIAQTAFIQDELQNGRLVAPFSLAVRTGEYYGIGWLNSRSEEPALKAFREWMSDEAAQTTAEMLLAKNGR